MEFVQPNLIHTETYFLDLSVNQPNNPPFFVLGLIGSALLPFQVYRMRRGNTAYSSASMGQTVFPPFFLILFLVVISYVPRTAR